MTTDDGSLRIDLRDGTVVRREEAVSLTPTESRLLVYLASRRGQVIPHKELLTNIWGPEYVEQVNYLNVYVRYLCHKIEDDPSHSALVLVGLGIVIAVGTWGIAGLLIILGAVLVLIDETS